MVCKSFYYDSLYLVLIFIMNLKTQAILSYLGLLWLVAYFEGKDQRDSFSSYHLKQELELLVIIIFFNVAAFCLQQFVPSCINNCCNY